MSHVICLACTKSRRLSTQARHAVRTARASLPQICQASRHASLAELEKIAERFWASIHDAMSAQPAPHQVPLKLFDELEAQRWRDSLTRASKEETINSATLCGRLLLRASAAAGC
jgi:hypothetical protein